VFLGLRTVVYPAPDLTASKAWWAAALGVQPYFDEPFYVGFNPRGCRPRAGSRWLLPLRVFLPSALLPAR